MESSQGVRIACTTLVVGVGLVLFARGVWKRRSKKPSGLWRQVGHVSGLNVYPIKSCKGIPLEKGRITSIGLEDLPVDGRTVLGDRRMVIYKEDSLEMVSARTYYQMLQLSTEAISQTEVVLTYKGQTKKVELRSKSGDIRRIKLWSEKVPLIDAGDEVAIWIQNVVFQKQGFRLGFWPDVDVRRNIDHLTEKYAVFYPFMCNEFTGAFSDLSPYLLLNESSVEDLRDRMASRDVDTSGAVVSSANFRGNILVRGPSSYEEDDWQWIKIGNDVVFRNFKPCTRCSLTTVNPQSSEKSPKLEPITTLKTYRLLSEEKRKLDPSPAMGIYIGVWSHLGEIIKVGDPVYVCD